MGYASQANWNVTHSGGISFLATRLVETGGSACFEGTRGFMIVKNMFFTQKTLKSKILNPKGILSNVALPNMFNITCYVTIRTGMRSIPVTECLRPNPLQPQARAIECPTRPFGAPRSACDRDEWGTRSHALGVVRFPAGGTDGTF